LLNEGYDGFKTGMTQTACPCLIATRTHKEIPLIITVLNSRSLKDRRKDVGEIYRWVMSIIGSMGEVLDKEFVKMFIRLI